MNPDNPSFRTPEAIRREEDYKALITTLKAENAELRIKLADFRIGAEQNELYISQGEQISNLHSEVARLRELGSKMIKYIRDCGQYEGSDEFQEALNHKPKGEKE